MYCPGHAGVKGNDRADTLAGGKATLTSGLLLRRSKVLRSLRHYLRAQSQGHHTTDRLDERGVERESARRSSLKGRERAIVSQTNIVTVLNATLDKHLKDGVERIWAFLFSSFKVSLVSWYNVQQTVPTPLSVSVNGRTAHPIFRIVLSLFQ